MLKTSTPEISMTAYDAQILLDAIVKLEHNSDVRIEAGHYSAIARLCKATDAPEFFTDYFVNKSRNPEYY